MNCIKFSAAVCYITGVDSWGKVKHLYLILIAVIQSVREIKEKLSLWEFGDSKL